MPQTNIQSGYILVLSNPLTGACFTHTSVPAVDRDLALNDFAKKLFDLQPKSYDHVSPNIKRQFVDYMIETGRLELSVVNF